MKMFVILCLLSTSFAEPPIGDGYPAARSLHHDHHNFEQGFRSSNPLQRSSTQGFPDSFISSRNALSSQYGPPNARSGLSNEYGTPNSRSIPTDYSLSKTRSGISTEYGAPGSRSISQEYGVPNAGFAQEYDARANLNQDYSSSPFSRGLSQEYGVPEARNQVDDDYLSYNNAPDQEYGTPSARNGLSNTYLPASRSAPSNSYLPAARSNPSAQYGAPDFDSITTDINVPSLRDFSQFSSQTPSQQYGTPGQFRSNSVSQQYGPPKSRSNLARFSKPTSTVTRSFGLSRNAPSQSYGAPASRSLSTEYGTPNARTSGFSQGVNSVSQVYGAPNQRSSADSYSSPNARGISQEYGVPAVRSNGLKTSAIASSYASARSSPSQKYGPPTARMASDTYGVPEQYNALSNQGYNYARNALDELENQEPANYDFGYKVNDEESGSDFGHKESRQENRAEGSYFVVLPDGTKQVVEYEADERGFKPRISVEPADPSFRAGGYDENAASIDGPY